MACVPSHDDIFKDFTSTALPAMERKIDNNYRRGILFLPDCDINNPWNSHYEDNFDVTEAAKLLIHYRASAAFTAYHVEHVVDTKWEPLADLYWQKRRFIIANQLWGDYKFKGWMGTTKHDALSNICDAHGHAYNYKFMFGHYKSTIEQKVVTSTRLFVASSVRERVNAHLVFVNIRLNHLVTRMKRFFKNNYGTVTEYLLVMWHLKGCPASYSQHLQRQVLPNEAIELIGKFLFGYLKPHPDTIFIKEKNGMVIGRMRNNRKYFDII
jgi:hypothetical protein